MVNGKSVSVDTYAINQSNYIKHRHRRHKQKL